jgi:flagellum-specific peptidoglycan hydrolase FlgJ
MAVDVVIVPRARTPLTREGMRDALQAGHHQAFGMPANRERETCALAQWCLECANGSAIHCWNAANVDATPDWTGDTFYLTAAERIGADNRFYTKQLRAYESAEDGAADYWRFLRDRFAGALGTLDVFAQFDAGDPVGAAHALKAARYYTGNEHDYAHAMAAIYAEVHEA